ncbi:MAG: CHAT domain-containing protein, partial [Gemmataceae bacterium]|nr:CHAT domain-containing protein [Gemmataceae bacterium]
ANLRDLAAVQSDRRQLAAAAVRSFLDNRLLLPDFDRHLTAAGHVLAWKGSVLVRQQQRRLFLRLSGDPAARREAERLRAATRDLAALRASPAAPRARLAALEKEQEEAQARLSALSGDFRAARGEERLSPEKLADALPGGAVLVDYLFYHKKLAAFVHRRGTKAARIDLGKAAPVEEAVGEWRPLLLRGRPSAAAGQKLRKLVLEPLSKHLEGAKALLVSPDGVLGTLPFAALPGKAEGSYLIEDVAVAVVPVPQALPDLLAPVDKKERLAPALLVAGDLCYEPGTDDKAAPVGEDSRSAPRSGRLGFAPLAATKAEIVAVKASFSDLFRTGTATDLRGGKATKKAVREHLPKARYAHFATYGFFAPEKATSVMHGNARAGIPDREVTGWHPLLLSGLALSGANRDPRPGEEDGILTALEVSEMDLTRLELAVLSACETGLGKVAGGQGILGMQAAFQAAGARSVIASLWHVDDEATRQLMSDYYAQAWDARKAVGKAEALRKAQLATLFGKTLDGKPRGVRRGIGGEKEIEADRAHPYSWAAFVLSGDWR